MHLRTIFAWLAVAVAAVSLGCVSSGKYETLEAERDALAAEQSALASELEMVREENEEMKRTYGELVRELQSEVEAGQISIQRLVDGIRLGVSDELLFSSGATTLDKKGTALIVRVAEQIKLDKSIVFVEGHTDNVQVGSILKERYPTNWELAGARAALVVRVLSEAGVDPRRLRAVSRGPFAPVAPNDTPENRARNRRTEIILRSPR